MLYCCLHSVQFAKNFDNAETLGFAAIVADVHVDHAVDDLQHILFKNHPLSNNKYLPMILPLPNAASLRGGR